MSVHKFGRPELDDEILTAMEYIDISKKALPFFVTQRTAVRRVRDALGRNASATLTGLLDAEIDSLDQEIDKAESAIAVWEEIQEILVARSKKP